ncbi:hypothetical protein ACSTKE_00085, partial [Vibrio parahaemolyticus]
RHQIKPGDDRPKKNFGWILLCEINIGSQAPRKFYTGIIQPSQNSDETRLCDFRIFVDKGKSQDDAMGRIKIY